MYSNPVGSGTYGIVYSDGVNVIKHSGLNLEHCDTINSNNLIEAFCLKYLSSNSNLMQTDQISINSLAELGIKHRYKQHNFCKNDNLVYTIKMDDRGQSLESFLLDKSMKKFSRMFFADIVSKIIDGLSQIHQNEFIHGDLKPSNILIKIDEEKKDCDVCIIDLGGCKHYYGNDEETCTLTYRAPEKEEILPEYDKFAYDTWSLGLIILELIYHENFVNQAYFNTDKEQDEKSMEREFRRNLMESIRERLNEESLKQRLLSLKIHNYDLFYVNIHKLLDYSNLERLTDLYDLYESLTGKELTRSYKKRFYVNDIEIDLNQSINYETITDDILERCNISINNFNPILLYKTNILAYNIFKNGQLEKLPLVIHIIHKFYGRLIKELLSNKEIKYNFDINDTFKLIIASNIIADTYFESPCKYEDYLGLYKHYIPIFKKSEWGSEEIYINDETFVINITDFMRYLLQTIDFDTFRPVLHWNSEDVRSIIRTYGINNLSYSNFL